MCFCVLFVVLLLGSLMMVCMFIVQLVVFSELININFNVKIEYEIYIKVDKVLDGIINENSGLF